MGNFSPTLPGDGPARPDGGRGCAGHEPAKVRPGEHDVVVLAAAKVVRGVGQHRLCAYQNDDLGREGLTDIVNLQIRFRTKKEGNYVQ